MKEKKMYKKYTIRYWHEKIIDKDVMLYKSKRLKGNIRNKIWYNKLWGRWRNDKIYNDEIRLWNSNVRYME